MYVNPVREMFPELWGKAPLERYIAHEELCLMGREGSITLRYAGRELEQEPHQSYSILRAKFDKWLAREAEKKGAMLVAKSRVDDLIIEDRRVVGVMAGGEQLRANVVIACDGVLSFLAQKAGLRKAGSPNTHAVGFKEIIELDREVLENRLNLTGEEGAARLFLGDVTAGKFGGGFLYTNKDSISLGIVVGIDALSQAPAIKAPDLLECFKQRPEVRSLIKDGNTVEYSAHVIPEGGLKTMGKLYGHGILVAGDAAGFSMNIGVSVRGMEYALASGYYAAKAAMKAKQSGDYSESGLACYERFLNDSFVLQDFKNFKESLQVLEYPGFFTHYPELAANLMKDLYQVPAGPKDRIFPTVKKYFNLAEIWGLLKVGRRMMKI
jgi:electron transfer flavoprotein-quinone oxidoreductase